MDANLSEATQGPTLYPVEGCGQCAEILAAHLLTDGCYEVMDRHLNEHVSRPGRLWGTQPESVEALRSDCPDNCSCESIVATAGDACGNGCDSNCNCF